MSTDNVKNDVTNDGTKWVTVLADAQAGLERAQRDVRQWKGTIAVIRKRIKDGSRWPQANDH